MSLADHIHTGEPAPEPPNPLEYRLARLRLGPGDVLVVKYDGQASADEIRRSMDPVRQILGGLPRILIIGPDVDLSVLTREDIEARVEASLDAAPDDRQHR